ncbi:SET domain-containing protein 3 [Cytospora mali]|uniref:SET domain-containing protein 3 n=1 Tax=Cytospora mali TaxID=578113 RepID=A0A194VX95_CYTMA|nr:SET domain-containing protein 3 [Valsa mali]
MTEKIPPLSTAALEEPEKSKPQEEDDAGVIKCICNIPEDDGSTVYCEKCDTWQHILCYYGESSEGVNQEDFDHSCADCSPRPLDKQKAVERQRARHGMQLVARESSDKKTKKAPSKTHKKKTRPNDLQLNGHTETLKHGSPLEHPPSKKAKTSHRSSQSVSSQTPKRSPSHSAPKVNHGHPLSPATTPPDLPNDLDIHTYTPQFLSLYDEADVQIVDYNKHANLKTTQTVSQWFKSGHPNFREDTGRDFEEVMQTTLPRPLNPPLSIGSKELSSSHGTILRRQYLTTPSAIDKDVPMMELNGLVGLQREYCEDPDNHWSELCAPMPFVFFPPSLPLYIDTRKEGSGARYVRRSCKPNSQLDTYLDNESEYHFWLVSDRPIAADEEVTLPWDFKFPGQKLERMIRLLGLDDEETNGHSVSDIDQSEYTKLSEWIPRILSEYGGCACDLGSDCAFSRFYRNYAEKVQSRPNLHKRKRAKSKQHTISPTSTGHATNSRAASEGHLDEVPDNDSNSLAGSRSKPPSRERTPARHGSFDTLGILTEPTNRDKRKVQIAENLFQKSAQEQQQPPRKKKKTHPDGTTNSSTTKTKGRNSVSHTSEKSTEADEHRYVDAGTNGSKSVSPMSAVPHSSMNSTKRTTLRHASIASASRRESSAALQSYCNAAVQTEPLPEQSPMPRPKRRVMSLTMRLVAQKRRECLLAQEMSASAIESESPATTKSSHGSPSTAQKQSSVSSPESAADVDTPMPEPPSMLADASLSPLLSNDTGPAINPVKVKSPELRVHMPPVPVFTSSTAATSATTPISANGSVVQSPFSTTLPMPFAPAAVNGVAVTPSPIKKKMSLSEYKNKANKAAASVKSALDNVPTLKIASPAETKVTMNGDHEPKGLEGSMGDSNLKETTSDIPEAKAGGATS